MGKAPVPRGNPEVLVDKGVKPTPRGREDRLTNVGRVGGEVLVGNAEVILDGEVGAECIDVEEEGWEVVAVGEELGLESEVSLSVGEGASQVVSLCSVSGDCEDGDG